MGCPLFAQIPRFFDALVRASPSPDGEGVATTLDHSWPWPPWVTLIAFILAASLVLLIYLREMAGSGRRTRLVLASIRILLVAIVVFMMYGWTRQFHRTDLPDLVVILDDSQSMAVEDHHEDEAERRERQRRAKATGLESPTRFNLALSLLTAPERGWLEQLAADYHLKLYLVGASARLQAGKMEQWMENLKALQPAGNASKLGRGVRDVLESQRGRPTAAIIMLTDGITTEGQTVGDVSEYARRKSIPLFLVGLGSDRPPRDVRLSDLVVDEVVFVDEMVNFDFKLHGEGYAGKNVTVSLRRRDQREILAKQTVVIPETTQTESVRLSYRPQEEGDFEHVIEVTPLDGEATLTNNRLRRSVIVRDATLRVLFLQAYPSYEFRFLKDMLSRAVRRGGEGTERAVELTTVLQQADLEYAQQDATAESVFPVRREDLFAYDVLLFGDVNPSFLSRSVMEHIYDFVTERGGGIVFVAGPEFTPLAYRDTPLANLLPVDLTTAEAPPTDQILSETFVVEPTELGLSTPQLQIGEKPAETLRIWRQLPGLRWLLAAPDTRPAARVLAVHPSRKSLSGNRLPVIVMQFAGAGKVMFHATDETYLWSRTPGSELYYARYWLQTLRYLSRSKLASNQQLTEITTDRQQYRRGDTVRIRVRFSDERRSPADDAGVRVIVQRRGGRKHQVSLYRDPTRRGLLEGTVSGLPDGQYRAWLATEGEQASSRDFVISAPPGEQARIAMDSSDLRQAAKTSRGKFYSFSRAGRLPYDLPRGRRVTIESLPPEPIWNSTLVAGAFVILITVEWLMRRRTGMV